jgi:hypothetical protein
MSFPYLVIILSLMAVLGPGLLNLIFTLSLLIAAGGARVIRGAALSVMQNPYLEAARAMGSGHLRIVLLYVLPNVMATIMILATIGLGGVILAESSLSFLGFGVPAPYPSWGAALRLRPLVHVPGAGWPSGGSRSRSPCSASTCWATRCATCWIHGCGDADRAHIRHPSSPRARPIGRGRRTMLGGVGGSSGRVAT